MISIRRVLHTPTKAAPPETLRKTRRRKPRSRSNGGGERGIGRRTLTVPSDQNQQAAIPMIRLIAIRHRAGGATQIWTANDKLQIRARFRLFICVSNGYTLNLR
jgi:hypothetical protein